MVGAKKNPRGGALGGTLLVIVLLFIFGLTLANLATFDLRLVNQAGERQAAREAAEAGLNHVIALIGENPTVGTNDEVFEQTLQDGSSYSISFDSDDSNWSLNNLSNLATAVRGSDRTVPPTHALIFAEGRSKTGVTALIESLIRLEALPYAIAANGKVTATAGVRVKGALTGGQAQAGTGSMLGSTYSGSPAPDSTFLGLLTAISGDVHSVGGATVNPAQVDGDVETDHDVVQLPNLVIEDFSTDGVSGRRLIDGGGLGLIDSFDGYVYINGPKTFATVIMNNATVYVDGDLDVAVLVGTGAIFVNGRTRFLVPISLNGASRITLFSKEDIIVQAAGVFQGVMLRSGVRQG